MLPQSRAPVHLIVCASCVFPPGNLGNIELWDPDLKEYAEKLQVPPAGSTTAVCE